MDENTRPILVMMTAPDKSVARKIADVLVEKKLAACVNISPNWTSVYRWKDEIQDDSEVLILIKTTSGLFDDQLVPCIQELHPYDLPEIIALPILTGERNYLDWVIEEASGEEITPKTDDN